MVYEANSDFVIASELADRVLCEAIEWLEPELLDSQRVWIAELPPGSRLEWTVIANRARETGIKVHGHFAGEPGLPDASAARRAIAYILHELPDVDAIVLVRDSDDQDERRQGLEQARAVFAHQCTIVVGFAIRERECWVLSGFDACNDQEMEAFSRERQQLGFDPCVKSVGLTAVKDDTALKSPKRVLGQLSGRDWERERVCWMKTPLDTLRNRGEENGLAAFLKEVRVRLVPLITGNDSHLHPSSTTRRDPN